MKSILLFIFSILCVEVGCCLLTLGLLGASGSLILYGCLLLILAYITDTINKIDNSNYY